MSLLSANFRRLALTLGFAAVVTLSGCAGDKKSDESSTPTAPSIEDNALGDSDSGKALGLQTVYFPYDSFVIDGEAKTTLDNNVTVLKTNASAKIQIEGHCDSRGGIQYNIALGEKRANAVKKYMTGNGVEADRVTTISYGKERPLDPGQSEEAHAKNRRGNFVITSR